MRRSVYERVSEAKNKGGATDFTAKVRFAETLIHPKFIISLDQSNTEGRRSKEFHSSILCFQHVSSLDDSVNMSRDRRVSTWLK